VITESERRTYFFNVKENRKGDLFLNIVESTKQSFGDFERHQIMVYEEDMEGFMDGLNKAVRFLRKKRREGDDGS
jgi:hypothetical protein